MAWWNQPEGAVTPTVTLRRLAAWLAVAQEVSGGRLIPALYTEVDDAGLSLCAEVLTNIGAGLDDAQLAGTMDFILDGVDEALREVLGVLDEAAGPTGTETAGETTAREAADAGDGRRR